ncbi:MAG: peptidylprolyl isomerase [Chitinophagaceae bacterium]|nr:peptidylprolyl isomerase [Chitinophagaceae bacterium]
MRNGLIGLFLFFSVPVFAQPTLREQFEKITTLQEAQKFVDANQALKPELYKLTYGKDSSRVDQRLLKLTKGDILSIGYTTYKIIESKESVNYRASYIFLDGAELSVAEIENLRKLILQKISEGVPFEKLSDEYTMDGNNTQGDTGWFFGEEMVPRELQNGVKNHKLGDIFFVDVPDRKWNYIVKKTYDDQIDKEITVLRANGR